MKMKTDKLINLGFHHLNLTRSTELCIGKFSPSRVYRVVYYKRAHFSKRHNIS